MCPIRDRISWPDLLGLAALFACAGAAIAWCLAARMAVAGAGLGVIGGAGVALWLCREQPAAPQHDAKLAWRLLGLAAASLGSAGIAVATFPAVIVFVSAALALAGMAVWIGRARGP